MNSLPRGSETPREVALKGRAIEGKWSVWPEAKMRLLPDGGPAHHSLQGTGPFII